MGKARCSYITAWKAWAPAWSHQERQQSLHLKYLQAKLPEQPCSDRQVHLKAAALCPLRQILWSKGTARACKVGITTKNFCFQLKHMDKDPRNNFSGSFSTTCTACSPSAVFSALMNTSDYYKRMQLSNNNIMIIINSRSSLGFLQVQTPSLPGY